MPKNDTRDANGRFVKGNTIGSDTRFAAGHDLSCKYDDKYCDMLLDYFYNFKDNPDVKKYPIPTFRTFALYAGISQSTMYNWCKDYPQFATAYDCAVKCQADYVVFGGLTGEYNAMFAKFYLECCHGYVAKSALQVSGTDADGKDAPFKVNITIVD